MSAPLIRDPVTAERRFARTVLFMTGGLLLWILNFAFVYVFGAIACARGFVSFRLFGLGIVPVIATLASLVAAALTGRLLVVALRSPVHDEQGSFLRFVACATCTLALGTFAWIGLPPLVVGVCGR
jgi:hypothetical protein